MEYYTTVKVQYVYYDHFKSKIVCNSSKVQPRPEERQRRRAGGEKKKLGRDIKHSCGLENDVLSTFVGFMQLSVVY